MVSEGDRSAFREVLSEAFGVAGSVYTGEWISLCYGSDRSGRSILGRIAQGLLAVTDGGTVADRDFLPNSDRPARSKFKAGDRGVRAARMIEEFQFAG